MMSLKINHFILLYCQLWKTQQKDLTLRTVKMYSSNYSSCMYTPSICHSTEFFPLYNVYCLSQSVWVIVLLCPYCVYFSGIGMMYFFWAPRSKKIKRCKLMNKKHCCGYEEEMNWTLFKLFVFIGSFANKPRGLECSIGSSVLSHYLTQFCNLHFLISSTPISKAVSHTYVLLWEKNNLKSLFRGLLANYHCHPFEFVFKYWGVSAL